MPMCRVILSETKNLKTYSNNHLNNILTMKSKEQAMAAYEAPKVEVIEVEVEKGFAASLDGQDGGSW